MKCRVCAGTLAKITTDLPFKLTKRTIVIIRQLPVLQCECCGEYSFDDSTCASVEEILAKTDAELAIFPFAARPEWGQKGARGAVAYETFMGHMGHRR